MYLLDAIKAMPFLSYPETVLLQGLFFCQIKYPSSQKNRNKNLTKLITCSKNNSWLFVLLTFCIFILLIGSEAYLEPCQPSIMKLLGGNS